MIEEKGGRFLDLSFDLQYRFPKGGDLLASLSIPSSLSGIVAILGPSGSGKTTLLHCLAGLQNPDSGSIRMGGITCFDSSSSVNLSSQSRSVGLLFQNAPLFPHLSVSENIAYGLKKQSDTERARIVGEWCTHFSLTGKEDRDPRELSGGEHQRVALAQILAPLPKTLLLDEPLSGLDPVTRFDIRKKLRLWIMANKRSALVVTHHLAEALAFSDYLIIMSDGRILQHGLPMEIFSRPRLPAVAKMVGVENLLPGTVFEARAGILQVLVGKVKLTAIGSAAPEQSCFLSIRAEEVILERGQTIESSARNRLKGRIEEIIPYGSLVGVVIDCGFLLNAKITEQSRKDLSLRPGSEITVVIKAAAIQILEGH